MTTKHTFIQAFRQGIAQITQQIPADSFHRQLYFSQAVTVMEKYLSDVFMKFLTIGNV